MQMSACPSPQPLLSARPDAALAQLVEHIIRNDGVTGSSPVSGTRITPSMGLKILENPRKYWYIEASAFRCRSPLFILIRMIWGLESGGLNDLSG